MFSIGWLNSVDHDPTHTHTHTLCLCGMGFLQQVAQERISSACGRLTLQILLNGGTTEMSRQAPKLQISSIKRQRIFCGSIALATQAGLSPCSREEIKNCPHHCWKRERRKRAAHTGLDTCLKKASKNALLLHCRHRCWTRARRK